MRLYLDVCCLNRPFDDQGQARIRLEAEAKLHIQESIRNGTFELAWSYVLDYENSVNPFEDRRKTIAEWKARSYIEIGQSKAVIARAKSLTALRLKPKDCLHLACAIVGRCDRFVTTDDVILKRTSQLTQIHAVDPLDVVKEMKL